MPKPTIGWFFNRTEIQKKVKVGMVNDDIIIPKMSREYVGTYTCVALQGTRKVFKSSMVKMMCKCFLHFFSFHCELSSHQRFFDIKYFCFEFLFTCKRHGTEE